MGKMKKYDSYKDSGIEWIGVIPSHWSYSHLKWYSQIYSGGTPSKDIDGYWIDGTIPWLNSGSVNQGDVTEVSEYITEEALKNSSAKWIPDGALIMALAGQGKTKGMVAQVKFKTTCNQSLGVIVPNDKINNRYLLYWLRKNYQNIRNLGGGDKRDGLNLVMVGGIPLPLPEHSEQTAIANYLDHKTMQIDDLIAKKERLILLLEEERTAIINQAVTKGLDPTVPMKDSGIDWLGEIPAHWEVKKLKFLGSVIGGVTYSPNDVVENGDEGKLVMRSSNIQNGMLSLEDNVYINLKIPEKQILRTGDILICSRNGSQHLIGKNICIEENMQGNTFGAFMVIYRTSYFKYLSWFFNSAIFKSQSGLYLTSTINQLTSGTLNNFFVTFPNETEQATISSFIMNKVNEIKKIVSKTQQEIELLKEYKKALIIEVVTGKVDVRDEKLS